MPRELGRLEATARPIVHKPSVCSAQRLQTCLLPTKQSMRTCLLPTNQVEVLQGTSKTAPLQVHVVGPAHSCQRVIRVPKCGHTCSVTHRLHGTAPTKSVSHPKPRYRTSNGSSRLQEAINERASIPKRQAVSLIIQNQTFWTSFAPVILYACSCSFSTGGKGPAIARQ